MYSLVKQLIILANRNSTVYTLAQYHCCAAAPPAPPPRPAFFFCGNAIGVSTTRVQASIEETTAEKTKAREALIASADMAELLKLVGVDDTVVRQLECAAAEYLLDVCSCSGILVNLGLVLLYVLL